MEPISPLASISHSIEYTTRSKSGLQRLQDLFINYASMTAMTRTFSAKTTSLDYFLQNLNALLQKLKENREEDLVPITDVILNLESRLATCQRDIEAWIERVVMMNLDSSRDVAAFKKTARIGFLTDDFVQIGQQATDHQHGMAADMQILFSWNINRKSEQHRQFEMDDLEKVQETSDISNMTDIGTQYKEGGSQVLGNEMVDEPKGPSTNILDPPATEELDQDCGTPLDVLWSCDSISGIEDAFLDYDQQALCIYCFTLFPTIQSTADWRYRGLHLVQDHFFGLCNLTKAYSNWKDMKEHLINFHKFDIEYSEVVFTNFERKSKGNNNFLYRKFEDTEPMEGMPEEPPDPAHRISALVKFILERLHSSGLRETLSDPNCRDHDVLREIWDLDGNLACVEEGIIIDTDIDIIASRDIFINGLIKSPWMQDRLSLQSEGLRERIRNLHREQRKRLEETGDALVGRKWVDEWLLESLSLSIPMQRILRRAIAELDGGIKDTDVDVILERLLVLSG